MSAYDITVESVIDSSNEPSTPDDHVYIVKIVVFDISEIDRNTDTRKAFAHAVTEACEVLYGTD